MSRPPLKAPSSLVPLLALLIVIGTLYFAREVLIPFSLAMLFAFILTPAVRQMEALHLGRAASVSIVTLVGLSLVGGNRMDRRDAIS